MIYEVAKDTLAVPNNSPSLWNRNRMRWDDHTNALSSNGIVHDSHALNDVACLHSLHEVQKFRRLRRAFPVGPRGTVQDIVLLANL